MKRFVPVLCALAVAACDGATATPVVQPQATVAEGPDQVFYGVTMDLPDDGVRRAHVTADSVQYFDRSQRLVFFTFKAEFFTSTGTKESVMDARRATYDRRAGIIDVTGEVLIVSADGRRITTEQARYNKVTNDLNGDTTFVASSADATRCGTGFKTEPSLTAITATAWDRQCARGRE